MLQQVLEQVSKKKSKHAGSTSRSKRKESFDSDSSVRSLSLSPYEQEDKVEPYGETDNLSNIERESKANDDDVVQRMKRLEEQVAAHMTNNFRQTAKELAARAKD